MIEHVPEKWLPLPAKAGILEMRAAAGDGRNVLKIVN